MSTVPTALTRQARVYSGYRRLLRVRKLVFAGDVLAMKESRFTMKNEFMKHQVLQLPPNMTNEEEHFEGLLSMIDESVDMLTNCIVRGELNKQTGNYEVKLRKENLQEGKNMKNNGTVSLDPPSVEPITTETIRKLEAEEEAQQQNQHSTTSTIIIEKTTCQASKNKQQ